VCVLLAYAATRFSCRSAPRYACGGGALVCLLPGVCLLGKPTPVRAMVYHCLLLDGATELDARRRMGAVFFNDSLKVLKILEHAASALSLEGQPVSPCVRTLIMLPFMIRGIVGSGVLSHWRWHDIRQASLSVANAAPVLTHQQCVCVFVVAVAGGGRFLDRARVWQVTTIVTTHSYS